MHQTYRIENKISGAGFSHVGDIKTACQAAWAECISDHTIMVVWSSDNERLAECDLRGTRWLSKRGHWEVEQLDIAHSQNCSNLAGMMGDE